MKAKKVTVIYTNLTPDDVHAMTMGTTNAKLTVIYTVTIEELQGMVKALNHHRQHKQQPTYIK